MSGAANPSFPLAMAWPAIAASARAAFSNLRVSIPRSSSVLMETIYPLLWVLFGSLKTKQEMLNNIWGPPSSLVFQNYVDAWRIAGMGSRIFSSVFVTGSALIILVAVATPCAYALARLRFPGRGLVLAVAVAAMLVPPQVMAIPSFMVARDLGLINNRLGIAFVYAATPCRFRSSSCAASS